MTIMQDQIGQAAIYLISIKIVDLYLYW